MEILNNTALKLSVPEHIVPYITDNIQKSEVIEKRGNITDILIYWGLDEMTRLNQLIKLPCIIFI